ncbi:MAG: porin family protein [Flavipsychrobacter sp.]
MKKFLLAILALGSVATANAQEHSWLVYGNVGITTQKDANKNNFLTWNVNPGIGYQFNTHWTVGLNLGWSQNSEKAYGDNNRTTINGYEIGPFVRYTRDLGTNGLFYYFGQLQASYMGGYTTYGSDPSYAKHTGFDIMAYPAIGMHVGKCWGINFSIGGIDYSTDKYDGAANANNSFQFTFGQQMNIGAQWTFGGHGGHKMHGKHHKSDNDEDAAPKKSKKSSDDDDE